MPTSSLGYWCSIAANRYFERLQARLGRLDITHGYFVLLTIEEGGGKWSQQELADRLDLDKVSMTRALDHLAERGYVERCDCVGDRRKYLVRLTPKARPAVKAIRQAYEDLNKEVMKGLNKAERDLFMKQLGRVVDNLRSEPGAPAAPAKRTNP